MQFDIITIFPDLFNSFLNESLIAKSHQNKVNKFCVHNLRKWSQGKHKQVDDRPYGGGAGMVLMAEPILKAVAQIKFKNKKKKSKVTLLSPAGKQFDQTMAKKFAKLDQLILICGRYQGVDARVEKVIDEKISIGPYILSGGELPAMALVETVARLIPGYLGNIKSLENETQIISDQKKSEHPQYTRPEIVKINNKSHKVPVVLLSGDHKKIKDWRKKH
ncbi:tRNA (guanosine(37)-N1)-methyltransferase TrmD [Patescibacteria group bacterium]|nr:tRNA (guanosine(37)-N1)-methyltransferase TrmD [Patescibacteria group bacterium]MBU4482287.1 tRNA (guanosine(37)-N1)-methyltransferase TrmD [Patescibacteria group bacterium]